MELTTARLALRPPTLDDAPAIQAAFGRWEIIRWIRTHVPWPYPDDGAETFLRDTLLPSIAAGTNLPFIVCLKGAVIGMITFKKEADAHRYEAGFWLAQSHWGKGYATEALIAACQEVRRRHPEADIYGTCDPENHASARVQEKAGFVLEGVLPDILPSHNGAMEKDLRVLPTEKAAT